MKRLLVIGCVLALAACSSDQAKSANNANNANNVNNLNNNENNRNSGGNNANSVNPPVVEREFDFSRPATVGRQLFVANATLNSVAVIDAESLGIQTVPVGFNPTKTVGPTIDTVEDSRVFVLNQGSSTVSVIEPESLSVESFGAMRHVNQIASNPTSTVAVAWFDPEEVDVAPPDADISAVSVITKDFEAQIAVGFRVRQVLFSDDGAYVIVVTDDGISRLEVAGITGDAFAPPLAVTGQGISSPSIQDLLVDPTGRYVVSRVAGFPGLVFQDLELRESRTVYLKSIPFDVDWVYGAELAVLVTQPMDQQVLTITVPGGLINLDGVFDDLHQGTMMMPDMGMSDMGAADMGDMGTADMDDMDMGMADMAEPDMDEPDMPVVPDPVVDGVTFINVELTRQNIAEISPDGITAMLFDGAGLSARATLVDDLSTAPTTRVIRFEKPLYSAKSDPAGQTFVAIHTKEEGQIPPGLGPADPEFIAKSWAISLVDVKSAFQQLVLTAHETNELSIYTDESQRVLYVTFVEGLGDRDVLVANLGTFSTSSFRLASSADGIGPIAGQHLIYVSQDHPQGRLSFVDTQTQERRTVTGYELNAGID